MITLARPTADSASHWYTKDGQPCHTVKCTTKDGERPTTIADARKLGLLPSVTNILRVLHKEALVQWRCEQVALACLTTPRNDSEPLDDFVRRVLHDEREHEQEAKQAADLGTRIHRALEDELSGRHAEHEMLPWIEPVWEWLNEQGYKVIATEKVLVGNGYAGRCDLIVTTDREFDIIWDFKSTKKLPKQSWWEHVMQCAAYQRAYGKPALCGNIYISTTDPGKFFPDLHENTLRGWQAFENVFSYWQIANDYYP